MDPQRIQNWLDKAKSDEEKQFMFWLLEALKYGLIEASSLEYEPFDLVIFDEYEVDELVTLKTKEKMTKRHIHQSESYGCDFCLKFTSVGETLLYNAFRKANAVRKLGKGYRPDEILIDVKGTYNPYQNDERYFSLVKKAVLFRYHMWVEKIVPFYKDGDHYAGFFKKTWCPDNYRWIKKRKVPTLSKKGEECPSILEFLEKNGASLNEKGKAQIEVQDDLFS